MRPEGHERHRGNHKLPRDRLVDLGAPIEEHLLLPRAEHRLELIILGVVGRAVGSSVHNEESGVTMAVLVIVGSRVDWVGVGRSKVVRVGRVGGVETRVGVVRVEIVVNLVVVSDSQESCGESRLARRRRR